MRGLVRRKRDEDGHNKETNIMDNRNLATFTKVVVIVAVLAIITVSVAAQCKQVKPLIDDIRKEQDETMKAVDQVFHDYGY